MRHRAAVCWLGLLLSSFGATAAAQEADLAIAKSGPETALAGSNVSYALSVTNFGPDDSVSVGFDDNTPPGTTFVSMTQVSGPTFSCSAPSLGGTGLVNCTLATMAAGASADFDLVLAIDGGMPPGTFITNQAFVRSETFDPNEKNAVATWTLLVGGGSTSDIGIQKTAPGATAADADLGYTIVVSNAGPDAAGTTSWSDTLPGDLTFVSLTQDSGPTFTCNVPAAGSGGNVDCSRPDLAAGATAVFTLTAHVPPGSSSGTQYVNTAVVTSSSDPNDENNASTTTTTVTAADVSVQKSAPANATSGDNISYSITVSNAGPDPALATTFVDSLPTPATFVALTQDSGPTFSCIRPAIGDGGIVSCQVALMPATATATFTLVVNVPQPFVGPLTNQVDVRTDSVDTNSGNDSATASTMFGPATTDVAAAKSAPASVVAGQTIAYTISISNPSANLAIDATLSDTLPAASRFVSLAQTAGPAFSCVTPAVGAGGDVVCSRAILDAGASASFDLVVQLVDPLANGAVVSNTATASSSNPDANPGNDGATATTTIINVADLAVTKTGPANASAGQAITYQVTVVNSGASPALAVQLSDPLPAGTRFVSLQQTAGPAFACVPPAVGANGTLTCTIATFAPGASASFSLSVSIDAAVGAGTTLTNTATASTTSVDANAGNDSGSAATLVSNFVDLGVVKTGPANASAGQTISYALTLTNAGTSPATSVQLADPLPAGTRFVSLQQTAGPALACVPPAVGSNGTVTCTIATLAPGAMASFTLTVSIDPAVGAGTTLTNNATASTTSVDANPGNDSGSAATLVSNFVDLSVAKTGPARVRIGADVSYLLDIANLGTSPATAVQLVDVLPPGTTFVSLVQDNGPAFTCTTPAPGATGTVTCSIALLDAGASARFTLVLDTGGAGAGTLTNTASASTTSVDTGGSNNAATAGTTLFVAIVTPTVVPALSPLALLALGLVLAMVGGGMQRRWR